MENEIVHYALVSCDMEHAHVVGPLYYIKLCDRSPGPYKIQLHRKAIIDVADDGTLAGIDLIYDMPPPPPLKEPASPWRDIESAPKDQIILVVSPFYDKSASTKIVAAFLSEGGWLYAEGFEADPEGPIPTHWMPLPEPPING